MLATYQLGRASLREALRILEVHGLILIRPGRGGGPVVANFSSRDFGRMATLHFHVGRATFRDLVQARMVMEPVMAGLAAQRLDDVAKDELDAALARMRSAMTVEDDDQYIEHRPEIPRGRGRPVRQPHPRPRGPRPEARLHRAPARHGDARWISASRSPACTSASPRRSSPAAPPSRRASCASTWPTTAPTWSSATPLLDELVDWS